MKTISKTIVPALLIMVFFTNANAQSCESLMGMTTPSNFTIRPVEVDTISPALDELSTLTSPSTISFKPGTATVDADNRRMFYIYTSDVGTELLQSISTLSGSSLVSPAPIVQNLYELQYHCNADILYALQGDAGSNPIQFDLVEVDSQIGAISNAIGPINLSVNFGLLLNSSTIDAVNNRYFFVSATSTAVNAYELHTIDLITGTVSTNLIPITDPIDIEYDPVDDVLIALTQNYELYALNPDDGSIVTFRGTAAAGPGAADLINGSLAIDPSTARAYFLETNTLGTAISYNLHNINLQDATQALPIINQNEEIFDLLVTNTCEAIADFEFTNACEGETTQFTDISVGALEWTWDFDDPASGAGNTSTDQNPTHAFGAPGTYNVTLSISGCQGVDNTTKTVEVIAPPQVDLGPDITTCANQAELDAGAFAGASYAWAHGPTTQEITALVSATYNVTVTVGTCSAADQITVSLGTGTSNPLDLGDDITACDGDQIVLDTEIAGADDYEWSNGETTQSITVTQGGSYAVTVTEGACEYMDDVTLTFLPDLAVDLGADMDVCDDNFVLDAGISGTTYQWSTGETTQSVTVTQSGAYVVTVSSGSCSDTDEITLNIAGNLQPDLGGDANGDIFACEGEVVTLDASVPTSGASYIWADGATDAAISVTQSGAYQVTVSSGTCSNNAAVNVVFGAGITMELGNDTTFCPTASLVLSPEIANVTGAEQFSWSTGATTQQITVTQGGDYALTVTRGGCSANDVLSVEAVSFPSVNLGEDAEICVETAETIVLDAGDYAQFLWSPGGEITQSISVTAPGEYGVEVTNDAGCTSMASIVIRELCESVVAVPTAFSPNNDQLNDEFRPLMQFVETAGYSFVIYDRWGNRIFATNNPDLGWDGYNDKGVLQGMGVYVWAVTYLNSENVSITEKGNVTLIR